MPRMLIPNADQLNCTPAPLTPPSPESSQAQQLALPMGLRAWLKLPARQHLRLAECLSNLQGFVGVAMLVSPMWE